MLGNWQTLLLKNHFLIHTADYTTDSIPNKIMHAHIPLRLINTKIFYEKISEAGVPGGIFNHNKCVLKWCVIKDYLKSCKVYNPLQIVNLFQSQHI